MTSLDGKVALVTGTSAGLGAASAKLFAQRGASVFGIARDAEKMAEVFADVPGGKFASVDVRTPEACRQAVADCVSAFGRLDVLVNVAGFHKMRHTVSVTDADWEQDLAVNLNGPFYLCRAALPHLLEVGGNIVNVASIAGVEGEVYSAGYCAAKHGLVGLTKSVALETAITGVTCNAICPGWVLTPLVQKQIDARAVDGDVARSRHDLLAEKQPSLDFVTPEQLGALALFLCSDAAEQVRGAAWNMDGGWLAQ
jgi:meso-butanediol dehydrogenase / (S,S)-butanediol dehydrogenase / diacetyl reductase